MFSREKDHLYSFLEFVAIKFTYKLHILKVHSGIFAPFRHLPISRFLRHNEMGFWNASKRTNTSPYFASYHLFSHF